MKKISFFVAEIRSSFWFVPIVILIFTIFLALGLVYLDNMVNYQPKGLLKYVFTESADSARSVLSTISGGMIGVAGTVFSITLVALTLASNHFGSRLLRNFMHERLNQIVLGTYISTYVYCLLVLNAVKSTDTMSFVPTFSVFVAILSAIANIILLIFFIHHIAISIQADKVIADISKATAINVNNLYGKPIEKDHKGYNDPDEAILKDSYDKKVPLIGPSNGYVQFMDKDILLEFGAKNGVFIEIDSRPGEYIVKDLVIGTIYCPKEFEEDPTDLISDVFIIGNKRTPQQDIEFSINQMVEIAARALSPGVNDPFTAIACIDNLSSTICDLTKMNFPSKYVFDKQGVPRVAALNLDFKGVMNAAFNQIRQFSEGSPSVVIRLMDAFNTIYRVAQNESQKQDILVHAKMVLNLAERSFDEEHDLSEVKSRASAMDLA